MGTDCFSENFEPGKANHKDRIHSVAVSRAHAEIRCPYKPLINSVAQSQLFDELRNRDKNREQPPGESSRSVNA